MRILLVDLESDWRGGQSQALLLLQGLRARGHDAELLSVSGAVLAERARANGVPVTYGGCRVSPAAGGTVAAAPASAAAASISFTPTKPMR